MADKIDISSITKFDGRNYHQWMFQLKCALRAKGLYGMVDGTSAAPAPAQRQELETWLRKDAQAMFTVTSAMDLSQIALVENCETSKEMIDKLNAIYKQTSEVNKLMAHESFHQYKMQPNDSIAKHIAKIENLAQQIKDCGDDISDTAIVTKILSTLPQTYRNVRQAWLSMDETKQTIKNLTVRLLDEERSMNAMQEEDTALAAMVKQKHQKEKDNKKRFPYNCYNCNRRGHMAKDCRAPKQVNNKNNETAFVIQNEECNSVTNSDEHWILDSGASAHMTSRKEYFAKLEILNSPLNVILGNSKSLEVQGKGTVNIEKFINGNWYSSTINDVLYVPSLTKNLLSEGVLTQKGMKIIKESNKASIYLNNQLVACAVQQESNKLYKMLFRTKYQETSELNVTEKHSSLKTWHERLGHINVQYLKEMVKKNLVDGVKMSEFDNFDCEDCIFGKQHRKTFKNSIRPRKSAPGELVYSDLCGPFQTPSASGARYMLLFKDSFTGYLVAYFIKNKYNTLDCFTEYNNKVKTRFGHSVMALHVDNGREYINSEFNIYLKKEGIELETTAPYTPEQNGRSERENRTIIEKVRTLLISASAPHYLWAEAANTIVYLLNRTPSKQSQKTPLEDWTGEKPYLGHAKIFGCVAYAHQPDQRRTKLEPKSKKLIFVGYDKNSTNYRLLDPITRKITVSCNVIFIEKCMGFQKEQNRAHRTVPVLIEFESDTENDFENQNLDQEQEDEIDNNQLIESDSESENIGNINNNIEPEITVNTPPPPSLRPSRSIKPPQRFENYELNLVEVNIPNSYEEAVTGSNAEEWKNAIKKEIQALNENKTWILQDLPDGKKAIESKWVFRVKDENQNKPARYKARLCAKGFAQQKGIDYTEIFSPTTRYDTIRVLLSVAANKSYIIKQFDIKTAFLYGDLAEEIYMQVPEGFSTTDNKVCRLLKSLYGLKQSPRCWNQKFNCVLTQFGFEQFDSDKCVYRGSVHGDLVLLVIYVDDGLLLSPSENALKIVLAKLQTNFEVKVCKVNNFVGLEIVQEEDYIFIHQENYINKLIEKFGMKEANPVDIPADPNQDLTGNQTDELFDGPYREVVGSLIFAAIVSRPDIAYAVGVVSRFLNNPTNAQWNAVKRILKYLKRTASYGIKYTKQENCELEGFCDSDYAADKETRRSVTGYVFKVSDGPITWCSKRQQGVSLSTTEAEYVAACQATKEAIWLRRLMHEIGINFDSPTNIYIDNQSAIRLIHNPEFHSRSKHIDIKYHFIREKYQSCEIEPKYVNTKNQEADILTKALPREHFQNLRCKMGLQNLF